MIYDKPVKVYRLVVVDKKGNKREIHRLATTQKKAEASALRLNSVSFIMTVEEVKRPHAEKVFGVESPITRVAEPVTIPQEALS